MKFTRTKLTLIGGLIIAALYFTSDFAVIDVEKTAIVVAIAVDKKEENYLVTAQIAIPKPTENASVNEDAVISSTGKTVLEAVNGIGADSGWHPKLSFCSMIFIGKEVAAEEVENIVDFFLTEEKVPNSAILALAEDKASELLEAKTPLDTITSFAIQKIVIKSECMVNTVGVTSLKSFGTMHYSKSKSAYMPVIDVIKGTSKDTSSESSGGGGGGGKSEDVVFNASKIALFKDGKYVDELDADETLCYYFFSGPVYQSFITVTADGKNYFLMVDSNDFCVDVDVKTLTVSFRLDAAVELFDSNESYDLNKFSEKSVVDERILKAAEKTLTETTESLVNKVFSSGADIFMIKDEIYKYHNADYERLKNTPLSAFTPKTEITVRSYD